ncbi:MAG TPA: hypothetical protein VLF39_04160 [Candidatus Saccharimonadales bacterium]|nr:hypothetical protein [Candidatus Saccharimonadales bacterium]
MNKIINESIPFSNNESFEKLGLPEGFYTRRLSVEDVEEFVAFDTWNYVNANPDTPTDHQTGSYINETVSGWFNDGIVMAEGIFDNEGSLMASLMVEPLPAKDALDLTNINTHINLRDRGIGHYFLDRTEAMARNFDLSKCTLRVDPLNSRGMHLYMEHGYKVTSYDKREKWLFMTNWLVEGPEFDYSDQIEIRTSEDNRLKETLGLGYVGTTFVRNTEVEDPKNNSVIFSKSV